MPVDDDDDDDDDDDKEVETVGVLYQGITSNAGLPSGPSSGGAGTSLL
jgi:hypothetical protein